MTTNCIGHVKTKWGTFAIQTNAKGICSVEFPKDAKTLKVTNTQTGAFRKAKQMLVQYFEGKAIDLNQLPVDLEGFTPFETKVYRALKKVKRGKTTTYGELAQVAGFPGAARAVGAAMNKNRIPLIIPCHRVIARDGKLTGFSAGLAWKKRLLELEESL